MTIYIDSDFKCYVEPAEDCTAVETEFFDGKCRAYIEGYRFVPTGYEWTRKDGHVFRGQMIAPWKDYSLLAAAQARYEIEDMLNALKELGVNIDG